MLEREGRCRTLDVKHVLESNKKDLFLLTDTHASVVGVGVRVNDMLYCVVEQSFFSWPRFWAPLDSPAATQPLPEPLLFDEHTDFAVYQLPTRHPRLTPTTTCLGEELTLVGTDGEGLRLGVGLVAGRESIQSSHSLAGHRVSYLGNSFTALAFGSDGTFHGVVYNGRLTYPGGLAPRAKPVRFGMKISAAPPETPGVVVLKGPPLSHSVRLGDIITHISNEAITSPSDFFRLSANYPSSVPVTVLRNGSSHSAVLVPLDSE